jgi:hypothetical protein
VTGDAELADSDSLELVLVELGSDDEEATPAVDVDVVLVLVPAVDVALVLDVAGAEMLVVAFGAVLAPCEPTAAIAAHASAKVERLAAATLRRVRLIRMARARRNCSPRVVEVAFVFDMGAT